ncbi:MAG: PhnD/SsuA/transferrin family substrate-binding protein [Deltaproteobacteria bacterium]|nr:PhnD/SsuA/transferrin family substrate-binding protein [Deltaproteobacteria bacterium]
MNHPKMSRRAKIGAAVVGGVLLAAATVVLVMAVGKMRDSDTVGAADNPFVLLLSPAYDATPEHLAALSTLLSTEAGFAVEVRRAPDARTAILDAGHGRADASLMPLFDYLFCHREYGLEAGARLLRGAGDPVYHGEILVKSEGGVESLAALSGKRVAFADRYSTSGFLYPARLLVGAGAEVVAVFAGSHEAALAALRAGEVDAAASYAHAPEPGLRVLARTADIPNEPIVFGPRVPPELRRRFVDALTRAAADPRGKVMLGALGGISGFTPTSDADYEAVNKEIEATSNELHALVPGGWALQQDNRRAMLAP